MPDIAQSAGGTFAPLDTRHSAPVTRRLFVKPEVQHIVILDDILFRFQPLFAGAFGLSLATRFDEIGKADYFGANKSLLHVGVDGAGGFPRADAFANRPGAVFLSAYGEKGNVTRLFEGPQQKGFGLLKFFG